MGYANIFVCLTSTKPPKKIGLCSIHIPTRIFVFGIKGQGYVMIILETIYFLGVELNMVNPQTPAYYKNV